MPGILPKSTPSNSEALRPVLIQCHPTDWQVMEACRHWHGCPGLVGASVRVKAPLCAGIERLLRPMQLMTLLLLDCQMICCPCPVHSLVVCKLCLLLNCRCVLADVTAAKSSCMHIALSSAALDTAVDWAGWLPMTSRATGTLWRAYGASQTQTHFSR